MTLSSPYLPIVPALRWSDDDGYGLHRPEVDVAVRQGAVGFILFGGTADAAHAATTELTRRAGRPLLFGSDLERGAGQQFEGATPLPPVALFGHLDDLDATYAAGFLTGREAVSLGVPWVFAPVADVRLAPENPIVGTRSFGADAELVARHVSAWINGCRDAGALSCAKHFPGHGRTREDSHASLPVVDSSASTLEETDFLPFRTAVHQSVSSVMTAHVAYPSLDPSGGPATTSPILISGLLRDTWGFGGVVVTDALIMDGAGDVRAAAVEALAAGSDLLLYPPEDLDLAAVLEKGLQDGSLDAGLLQASRRRVEALVERVASIPDYPTVGRPADRDRALAWASAGFYPFPNRPSWTAAAGGRGLERKVHLTVVDDDVGGPYPAPSRKTFTETLRGRGVPVTRGDLGNQPDTVRVLTLYADPRAWKGRAGLSDESRAALAAWDEATQGRSRVLILCGSPDLVAEVPPGVAGFVAWGGEPLMQEAAARHLAQGLH